jgi:hypothetical protein
LGPLEVWGWSTHLLPSQGSRYLSFAYKVWSPLQKLSNPAIKHHHTMKRTLKHFVHIFWRFPKRPVNSPWQFKVHVSFIFIDE